MAKGKRFIFLLLLYFGFSINVKALETFYINENGVHFTAQEYECISKLYWEGFQEKMTLDDYNIVFENGMPLLIKSKEQDLIVPYASNHSTNNKTIKVTKAGFNGYTLVTTIASWYTNPIVRSYDLVGAYLDGVALANNLINTRIDSTDGMITSSEIKKDVNGFGVSIKLPSLGQSIIISQTFRVTGKGTVYASYQHAKRSISLANSKKYSISRNGYGGVFKFENSIKDYYDAMGGVDIEI